MDKVSVFESSDFGELRIIVDPKGDVWFVASDVAKSLGYINAKDAVKRHVDVQYVFAMYYSDGFPKVFKCENELVKATLMYLDDPDAPEGVAFIRWLAVQDYLGEKINWKDLRSRSRSFRWCGSHSKKYDSRIPVFPVWKKRNKNIIPVGGQ